jgi:hypothetical protein
MSTYNNNRFTPGNKSNLRQFMNKEIIRQYYRTFNSNQVYVNDISDEHLCGCIQQKTNLTKQGWNDSSQTENNRVATILTGTLGGKTTFGNFNRPVTINYLGSWEGGPGGSFRPLRNKF